MSIQRKALLLSDQWQQTHCHGTMGMLYLRQVPYCTALLIIFVTDNKKAEFMYDSNPLSPFSSPFDRNNWSQHPRCKSIGAPKGCPPLYLSSSAKENYELLNDLIRNFIYIAERKLNVAVLTWCDVCEGPALAIFMWIWAARFHIKLSTFRLQNFASLGLQLHAAVQNRG